MLCDEVETVREFTYLVDGVSVRTRCGWVESRECGELLFDRRFPLKLKGAVYKGYVRPAILCRSEAWCLKGEVRWGFYKGQRDPRWEQCVEYNSKVKNCALHADVGFEWGYWSVGYGKHGSLVWSGLAEGWWSCLENGIRFWVEGQRKVDPLKRTWKKQVEEQGMRVSLKGEDAFCWSMCVVWGNQISTRLRWIWPTLPVGDATRF